MAVKQLHVLSSFAGATKFLGLQDGGTAPSNAATNPITGVAATSATLGPGSIGYDLYAQQLRPTGNYDGATAVPKVPDGATNGHTLATLAPISGSFAAANWTLSHAWASNSANVYNGRFTTRFRVFKGTNANGSGATELTASVLATPATVANLGNGTTTALSVTWAAPAITLNNEYLFVTVGIHITAAGSAVAGGRNIVLWQGAGSLITTSDFTAFAGIPYACGMLGT